MNTDRLFPATAEPAGSGFTARDLLRQAFKYWGTLLITVALVTVATLYGVNAQPPLYLVKAKVWVRTDQQGSPSFLSGVAAYREGQLPDPVNRKIETEMQLLLSQSSVEAVVRRLDIRPEQLPDSPLNYVLSPARPARSSTGEQKVRETTARFIKAVKVEPARSKTADTTSNVLEIQLEATDAVLAPRALNALVEQYQRFGSEHTRRQGEATYRTISQKLQVTKDELGDLDSRILALTVAGGTWEAGGDERAPRADAEPGNAGSGANSAIAQVRSQLVAQEAHLEELRLLYTDDAEAVRNAKRQLAQTQARLRARVSASAEQEARIHQLERARGLVQDRFVELTRKLDQIELYLNSALDESSTRVLTEAAHEPDKPESRKKLLLCLLGPVAGIALGLLLAGVREYFDHRLQSSQDVARHLGLETLGVIPDMKKAAS
jgi:uncharacterized protein involved in exopolysaccharide biosynthesis